MRLKAVAIVSTPTNMSRTCSACGAVNRIPVARLADVGRCGRCKVALPPSTHPIDIADATTFDRIVGEASVPILVDFWAPWCGPCRMVAPEVERAAATTSGRALVLKVNTEVLPELATRYRVQGIPNFIVFERGVPVRQRAGAMRQPELLRLLEAG